MNVERKTVVESMIAPRPLDRLLLDEANHRVANEVSSAIAALRLALSAKGERARELMIKIAIDRLEGFGECSRLLASVSVADTDAANLLEQICRAMVRSRVGEKPDRVRLDLREARVAGETARRTAMIAFELVTNALAYAFSKPGGELTVRLERIVDGLVLTIIDDGPGFEPAMASVSGGKRLGGRIVSEIVRVSGGTLECDTGPHGTAIRVTLPVHLAA